MFIESDNIEEADDSYAEVAPRQSKSLGDMALDMAMILLAPILIPTTFGILTFLEIKESRKKCLNCKSNNLEPLGAAAEPAEAKVSGGTGIEGDIRPRRAPSPYNFYRCGECHFLMKSRFGEAVLKTDQEELIRLGLKSKLSLNLERNDSDASLREMAPEAESKSESEN